MNTFLSFAIFFIVGTSALAIEVIEDKSGTKSVQVINQVLFFESSQSWTSRDFELFEKVKKEVLQKSRISQFTESENEDFLLSRLSAREALLFEVIPAKFRLSEAQKKSFSDYSTKEIDEELSQLGLATSLIDIKEDQLKQKIRFKTWLDLLKRKYQVRVKSLDFK